MDTDTAKLSESQSQQEQAYTHPSVSSVREEASHEPEYMHVPDMQAVSEHDMNAPFGRVPAYWNLRGMGERQMRRRTNPPYSYMLTFI